MTTTSAEIEKTLRLMLAGCLDLIQGCRILVRHATELEEIAASEYRVIAGVESETDDLPLGEVRTRWAEEALEEKDREKEVYLQRIEPLLRATCEAILKRVTKHFGGC